MALLPSIKRLAFRRAAATAAAYELADTKLPLDGGEPRASSSSSPSSCRRLGSCKLPDANQALRRIRWFGSLCVSVPLLLASLALSCVFFGVVLLGVDVSTTSAKLGFRPLANTSYSAWGTAMFIVVPILWMPMLIVCFVGKFKAGRWMHYFITAVYLTMLVVANVLGAAETRARESVEPQFITTFNELYCDSRTLYQCLLGGHADTLMLIGRGNATLLDAAANKTEGVLSVWTSCRHVLIKTVTEHSYEVQPGAIDAARSSNSTDVTAAADADRATPHKNIFLYLSSILILLEEVPSSRETDEWCVDAFVRGKSPSLSDAEQRAAPAPYSTNPDLYATYVDEWPRRLRYSNGLLGSAVGCMLLAAVSWKVARSEVDDI